MNQGPIGTGRAPEGETTSGEFPPELLMRYLDGELSIGECRRVEEELERSTELRRELALYRTLRDDLAAITFDRRQLRNSVWARVNRRLTRPIGWLLFGAGATGWMAHVVYLYLSSAVPSLEKVATSAVVIGILLLLASVIHERYRDYLTDPYRHVER